jgi:hypothetical protein
VLQGFFNNSAAAVGRGAIAIPQPTTSSIMQKRSVLFMSVVSVGEPLRLPPNWPKQQCRTQSARFAPPRRPFDFPGNMGATGRLSEG